MPGSRLRRPVCHKLDIRIIILYNEPCSLEPFVPASRDRRSTHGASTRAHPLAAVTATCIYTVETRASGCLGCSRRGGLSSAVSVVVGETWIPALQQRPER